MKNFIPVRDYFDSLSTLYRTDFYEALEHNDLEKAYDILFDIEESLDERNYEVSSLVNFGRQAIQSIGDALNEMDEGLHAPSLRSMKTLDICFSRPDDE